MKTPELHSLLNRQLARHFPKGIPSRFSQFIDEVSRAYHEADKDRELLERTLEIASAEMLELNKKILTDMNHKLTIERELQETKVKLLSAQKNEALGRLAGNIAHDFNNLLAIIRGNADMLPVSQDAEVSDMVHQIQLATERGSGLTRQILAYTKSQKMSMQVHNLNQLLTKYKDMIAVALGKGVNLTLEMPPHAIPVQVDEDHFTQVLLNLATNAKDAMEGMGKYGIRVHRCKNSREVCGAIFSKAGRPTESCDSCNQSKEYALLEFSDTGPGILPENISKIFEPYFSTKELGHGTGLGLAVVFGIVKQMQGYIYCVSQPGKGATFQIRLPIVQMI